MQHYFKYKGRDYNFSDLTVKYAEVQKHAPVIIGQEAVNFFRNRFREQGWRDGSFQAWEKRKLNNKRSQGRGILIKSGRLMRAIYNPVATFKQIVIANPTPYAIAHNEGFKGIVSVRQHTRRQYSSFKEQYKTRTGNMKTRTMQKVSGAGTVRAHTRKMDLPKRQFMGDSKDLDKIIDDIFTKAIDHIF